MEKVTNLLRNSARISTEKSFMDKNIKICAKMGSPFPKKTHCKWITDERKRLVYACRIFREKDKKNLKYYKGFSAIFYVEWMCERC